MCHSILLLDSRTRGELKFLQWLGLDNILRLVTTRIRYTYYNTT